jgi:fatty acid CoA ligase FadD9
MPLSHVYGLGMADRHARHLILAAKSDMSTLFEDISLVRPTELSLVPRV